MQYSGIQKIQFLSLFVGLAILIMLFLGCEDMGPNPHPPRETRISIQNYVSSNGYKCLIRNVVIRELSLSWPAELLYGARGSNLTTGSPVSNTSLQISFEYTDTTGFWMPATITYTKGITSGALNIIAITRNGSTQTTLTVRNAVLVKGRACAVQKIMTGTTTLAPFLAYGQAATTALSAGVDAPFIINGSVQLPDTLWSSINWYGTKDILFGENAEFVLTGEKIVFNKCEVRVKNDVSMYGFSLPVRNIRLPEINYVHSGPLTFAAMTPAVFVNRISTSLSVLFDAQLPHGEWVPMTNVYAGGIAADSVTTIVLKSTPAEFATVQLLNKVTVDSIACDIRELAAGQCSWPGVLKYDQSSDLRIMGKKTTPLTITGQIQTRSNEWQAVTWATGVVIQGGQQTVIALDNKSFSRVRFKNSVVLDGVGTQIKDLRMKNIAVSGILAFDSTSRYFFADAQAAPLTVTGSVYLANGGWKSVQWQVAAAIEPGRDVDIILDAKSLPIAYVELKNSARMNFQPAKIRKLSIRELAMTCDTALAPGEKCAPMLTFAYAGLLTISGEIEKAGVYFPFQFSSTVTIPSTMVTTIDITVSIVENAQLKVANAVSFCGVACAINAVKIGSLVWNTIIPYGSISVAQPFPATDTTLLVSGMIQWNGQWFSAQWNKRITAPPGENVTVILDSVVLDPPTFIQIRNDLAPGGGATIRDVEIVGSSVKWAGELAFGKTSTGQIFAATTRNTEIRFEYLHSSGVWKKRWYVHETPIVAHTINTIAIKEFNNSVTTVCITNAVTIDGYKCQVRNCRMAQQVWPETIQWGKTTDSKIIQPQTAPFTLTAEVLLENSQWAAATWQIQQTIRQGENSELILDAKNVNNKAFVNFKNLCKEKITGGNYVYYQVRGLKCKQLYQSWADEVIGYNKMSSEKSVEAATYDSLVIEGEIKPETTGSWVGGTWTLYKVTIVMNNHYEIPLAVEKGFRRGK
ncbi:MAG: hypothetical protein JW795_05860 [Chitinivibrionales bacterium]|nr:hypothetical protein [Chitinivibrionales bacterium]